MSESTKNNPKSRGRKRVTEACSECRRNHTRCIQFFGGCERCIIKRINCSLLSLSKKPVALDETKSITFVAKILVEMSYSNRGNLPSPSNGIHKKNRTSTRKKSGGRGK